MWSLIFISTLLFAVSIGTYFWQRGAWVRQQREELSAREREFFARRHYRRSQISLVMGGVAGAMVSGVWLRDPLVVGLLWLGVLLALVWIMLLAMIDAHHSHAFFSRERLVHLSEQAAWRERAIKHKPQAGDSET
jgi:hypothetical protein